MVRRPQDDLRLKALPEPPKEIFSEGAISDRFSAFRKVFKKRFILRLTAVPVLRELRVPEKHLISFTVFYYKFQQEDGSAFNELTQRIFCSPKAASDSREVPAFRVP